MPASVPSCAVGSQGWLNGGPDEPPLSRRVYTAEFHRNLKI
jgi:hypothetical protein